MLLALRPLQVGEYIETPGFFGTVDEIGLFSTSLKTPDGLFVYIPNGQVWSHRLQNYARHTERRLSIDIGVSLDTDLDTAKKVMTDVLRATPNVQDAPAAPDCFVIDFAETAIVLSARCWLPSDNWLAVTSDTRLRMKKALDAHGINICVPHQILVSKNE